MKNTFTKFLSIVLAALMCMGTLTIGAFAEEECTHANSTDYGVKEATCTEMGGHLWKCNDCGKEYATDVVPAKEHDLTDVKEVAATCGQNAYTEGKCKNCNETIKVEKAGTALTHEAGTEVFTKAPDCETGSAGYKYNKCTKCGAELKIDGTEVPGKHVYELVEVTKLPNCTEKGEVVYKCVNEGCAYTVKVEIAALGHKIKDVAQADPACDKEGVKAHKACERCGALFEAALDKDGNLVATTADKLVIAKAHPEASRVVIGTTAGTCDKKATTTYKCGKCSAEWTEEGDFGHSWKVHETKPTCDKYGYINYFCELCGIKYHNAEDAEDPKNEQVFAPLGHTFDVTKDKPVEGPYDATCDKDGYSVFNCDRCGKVEVIDAEKPALGHDMQKSADEVAPKCGVAGKTAVFTCKNGCGKTAGGEPIDALEHKYVDTKVAQTCLTDGYTTVACEYCGVEKADAVRKDIVKADGTSHKMAEKVIIAATCDKDGSLRHYCAICDGNDTLEVLPATGHNFNTEADLEVPGTCQSKAYAIYACMNRDCDALTTVFGEYDTSAEGHERAMGGEGANPRVLREGTCEVKGLIKYTCTVCNENYDKNTDYCTTDAHNRTEMPAVAPDCTTETNGYEADGIKCTKCDKWVVEPTVIPYEHTMDGKCDAQAETCTADGWTEFTYCTVCEASGKADAKKCTAVLKVSEGIKIPAHDYAKTKAKVEAQAPTCTEDGWTAFEYCTKCTKLEDAKKAHKVAKLGHKWNTVKALSVEAENGCVDYSFDCQLCDNCNGLQIINYVEAEDHDWVAGTKVAPDCDDEGYTPYTCSKCGATKKEDKVAPNGHINAAKEKFYGYCDDKVTDRKCTVCGIEVTEKNERHTFETIKTEAPTCTLPGYDIAICTREGCDEQLLENYVKPLGHKNGALIADKCVAPTYTAAGVNVYKCANGCGEELTEEVPALAGVKVTIKADSGILAGADVVNGGLVNFVIALETANLKANSLLTTIVYDSDVLTFVDAKVENIFGGAAAPIFAANVEDVTETDTVGTLKIYSYADKGADAEVQDVTLNGEIAYATLTFKVNTTSYDAKTAITVLPIELINAKGESAATSNAVTEEVEIVKLGDVNADGLINSVDTQLVRKIMAGELVVGKETITYSAVADIDMDGEVTLNDFARLSQYLIGAITYEALVLNK